MSDLSRFERELTSTEGKLPVHALDGKKNDSRRQRHVKKFDEDYKEALKKAANTDMLLQEEAGFLEAEGMEKTFRYKQEDIAEAVDLSTSNKKFKLTLPDFGPYTLDYTRNGRDLVIAGKKGHVAAFDWRLGTLHCELNLNETIHDVKYLHNNQFFATAQKKFVFIYDKKGTEIHKLKDHQNQTLLDFLPYHFLLASAGNSSYLKYTDTSTGKLVSELPTKLGPTVSMAQNPWNAVMHLGHTNGQVTLWAPKMKQPLVKLQSSRGPIRSLAINRNGNYMACVGTDKTVKIWDVRKFEELDTYYTPTQANNVTISDTGLLSVSWGPHVTIWKDTFKTHQDAPYMTHLIPSSQIQRAKFVPFEDILGVGHNKGIESLIIPGAGESNYDAMELNPFETSNMRKEGEIKSLLNKLQPDMITLDPNVIGNINRGDLQEKLSTEDQKEIFADKPGEISEDEDAPLKDFVKTKKALKKFKKKKGKYEVADRAKRIERVQDNQSSRVQKQNVHPTKRNLDSALSRFN